MPKITQNLDSQDVSKLLYISSAYTKPKANTSYSVGDTHGNAIVLIRYLYEAGIININQEQYNELIKIYEVDSYGNFSQLTKNQCEWFREIVESGFKDADIPDSIHLRFFGDMFADRGSNDILSLIVLDELQKRFPSLRRTILISNHDKSLLSNFLLDNLHPGNQLVYEVYPCPSLSRLKLLIDNKIISYDKFKEMFITAYLPALKFVDYVSVEDNAIDIMAHAPITLNIISNAMEQLIPLEEQLDIYESVENVMEILDKLNNVFVSGLTDNTSFIYKALTSLPTPGNPINAFIWTRLEQIGQELQPAKKPKYTVRFRHGHDGGPGETINHGISYIGYNSILGKTTPKQWGQAAVALLTMSILKNSSEEKNKAFNDVITAQMDPTNVIEQHAEDSIQVELLDSKKNLSSTTSETSYEDELISFQTRATLRLNEYISTRGSYTDSVSGERIWTFVADSRNKLRGFFGSTPVDVPQVQLAKELKQTINATTANNFANTWTDIQKSLDSCLEELRNSNEYTKVITEIVKDVNEHGLLQEVTSIVKDSGYTL